MRPDAFHSRDDLGDLAHDLLAVAEHDHVEEVGQRLGVVGAVAAGHDQRMLGAPVGGAHRHAGQVDAVEQVGVDELGRQVERQQVEGAGRRGGCRPRTAADRAARSTRLEVGPRGVGALGDRVGALVEDLVEDLQALVGQPDLVGVGVDEQPRHLVGAVLGGLAAVLAPDVAGRLLDPGQQGFELWPDRVSSSGRLPDTPVGQTVDRDREHVTRRRSGRSAAQRRSSRAMVSGSGACGR